MEVTLLAPLHHQFHDEIECRNMLIWHNVFWTFIFMSYPHVFTQNNCLLFIKFHQNSHFEPWVIVSILMFRVLGYFWAQEEMVLFLYFKCFNCVGFVTIGFFLLKYEKEWWINWAKHKISRPAYRILTMLNFL